MFQWDIQIYGGRSGTSQINEKKIEAKVLMHNTNFLYDGRLLHQRRDWCATVSVCFPERSSRSHMLHRPANIISILFLEHIYIRLPCHPLLSPGMAAECICAPGNIGHIVSCSAEASKNQLGQKHSVNIKGMQRRFCF